ncbi:MAG: SLC13 family permease [Bryobacteraceae bacterium]
MPDAASKHPDGPVPGLRQRAGLWVGLALFVLVLAAPAPAGLEPKAQRMAAIALLMAVWWISEAIPIAATSLLPMALGPVLGVAPSAKIALAYGNHIIFLFLGGFVLALGMERCGLHRRLALGVIDAIGSGPARLILGFMVATAFLSMWVSNTATTLVMLPIATAVIRQLATPERERELFETFGSVLLLGVAFSASVGGVGTIIGTTTTVAFLGFLQERFPDRAPISFLDWARVGMPIAAVFIPVMWAYLCRFGGPLPVSRIRFDSAADVIAGERRKLGAMAQDEKALTAVCVATALAWMLRPWWAAWFPDPKAIHDTTVAVAMAVLLFMLPERWTPRPAGRLMDWETVQRGVPWGILLLMGGGFAMAAGIEDSGLAAYVGSRMGALRGTPVWVLMPAACLIGVAMTEVTSNVATVLMLAPVLVETALGLGIDPYLLLIPTTIMSSFAFMLPVATPPNAVVFASGWIRIEQMFRVGIVLDLLALAIVPLMVWAIGAGQFK